MFMQAGLPTIRSSIPGQAGKFPTKNVELNARRFLSKVAFLKTDLKNSP